MIGQFVLPVEVDGETHYLVHNLMFRDNLAWVETGSYLGRKGKSSKVPALDERDAVSEARRVLFNQAIGDWMNV